MAGKLFYAANQGKRKVIEITCHMIVVIAGRKFCKVSGRFCNMKANTFAFDDDCTLS